MNEKLTTSHEQDRGSEQINTGEQQRQRLEELQKAASQEAQHTPEQVGELSKSAADEAISARETTVGENAEDSSLHSQTSPTERKIVAYKQSLKHVRERLPTAQRTLSRVIHQPAIDAVSDVSAKTVARPIGLLGGGLFALVGSIILLYFSKHYGFTYNYFVFVLLFASGFIVSSIAELMWFPFRRHRHAQEL